MGDNTAPDLTAEIEAWQALADADGAWNPANKATWAGLKAILAEARRLRNGVQAVYDEAAASLDYHRARASGGMCPNHHPGYPPSIAIRVTRDLGRALGKEEE